MQYNTMLHAQYQAESAPLLPNKFRTRLSKYFAGHLAVNYLIPHINSITFTICQLHPVLGK